ncbi:MAG: hypothetical protein KI793_29870 [Rivularia sp. (in: Bacteria)]|nr:hypothetical protein [Rivularia sp. MS3]
MNIIGLPTAEQLKTGFVLSASLTSMYQTISLIRIDEKVDSPVRYSAVVALGNLGDAAKPYIEDEDIAAILKD